MKALEGGGVDKATLEAAKQAVTEDVPPLPRQQQEAPTEKPKKPKKPMKEDDRRRFTSSINMARARLAKLEKLAKEREEAALKEQEEKTKEEKEPAPEEEAQTAHEAAVDEVMAELGEHPDIPTATPVIEKPPKVIDNEAAAVADDGESESETDSESEDDYPVMYIKSRKRKAPAKKRAKGKKEPQPKKVAKKKEPRVAQAEAEDEGLDLDGSTEESEKTLKLLLDHIKRVDDRLNNVQNHVVKTQNKYKEKKEQVKAITDTSMKKDQAIAYYQKILGMP